MSSIKSLDTVMQCRTKFNVGAEDGTFGVTRGRNPSVSAHSYLSFSTLSRNVQLTPTTATHQRGTGLSSQMKYLLNGLYTLTFISNQMDGKKIDDDFYEDGPLLRVEGVIWKEWSKSPQ